MSFSANIHLNLTSQATARPEFDCIDLCVDRPRLPEIALFLPQGISADKLQTIVDAINDALDSLRAPKLEAAE